MKRFIMGFVYAKNGIIKALQEERNLRLHAVTAVIILLLSSFYSFTKAEFCVVLLLLGGVLAFELVNSAIERAVDKPSEQHFLSAGAAKDMAAGAVLVYSVISAVCGFILFWDIEAFKKIFSAASANPIIAAIIIVAVIILYALAFKARKEDK